ARDERAAADRWLTGMLPSAQAPGEALALWRAPVQAERAAKRLTRKLYPDGSVLQISMEHA
ncbi:unnamed protein product, partial [Prorocentrum cordatum]